MGIISYIWSKRLILRGYKSYLIYICDISKKSLSLDSVPIGHNFNDVFPTNLPSLPPQHYIEFVIDLELGTQPISMVPYYMPLVELKELTSQFRTFLGRVLLY